MAGTVEQYRPVGLASHCGGVRSLHPPVERVNERGHAEYSAAVDVAAMWERIRVNPVEWRPLEVSASLSLDTRQRVWRTGHELAHKRTWATRADARRDLIRWIEGWFNPRRLHSTLGYRSPIETETDWYRDQTEAHLEAA